MFSTLGQSGEVDQEGTGLPPGFPADWTEEPTSGGGFSWSQILANFGFYPPALGAVAAAAAHPTLFNIRAVENAYRQGGYQAPGELMDWLYSRYYEQFPRRIPGQVTGMLGQYWPI